MGIFFIQEPSLNGSTFHRGGIKTVTQLPLPMHTLNIGNGGVGFLFRAPVPLIQRHFRTFGDYKKLHRTQIEATLPSDSTRQVVNANLRPRQRFANQRFNLLPFAAGKPAADVQHVDAGLQLVGTQLSPNLTCSRSAVSDSIGLT